MRIAFVDLFFSWPPHGGADVDFYHTVKGLQSMGHEVRAIVANYDRGWERGAFNPDEMPFPSEKIPFGPITLNHRTFSKRIKYAVDRFKPDVVFVGDGFFLKPYVLLALGKEYPVISRQYAYELGCIADTRLFKNGASCSCDYLHTPDTCRPCAISAMAKEIKNWRFLSWTHEFLAAWAFAPGYYDTVCRAHEATRAVIVYNDIMARHLENLAVSVHVLPGGVDITQYPDNPPAAKGRFDRKVIFMPGRVEDSAKGFDTLHQAGRLLAERRDDFEVWVTHTDYTLDTEWLKTVGWHSPAEMPALYSQSDICVVPSVWEEPFGLVAVEAMAAARPVVASRVGGLKNIVRHERTGYLFEAGNANQLADCLEKLLDSAERRIEMGNEGRRVAEREYDWPRVIERYYPPLLERLMS